MSSKPTRLFNSLHVASCLTGVALTEMTYRDIQAVASWLFGDSVYTHELVHEPTMSWVREEGYRQFPDMPTHEQAHVDWKGTVNKVLVTYGPLVEVEQGPNGRREHPVATLRAMLPDKPIIVVDTGEDAS
jgi:hypothetical protein